MENPRLWFDKTNADYEAKIRQDPQYAHYTNEQVRIRALGETYNNWILRFRRRGMVDADILPPFLSGIQDTDEYIRILGVDQGRLFDVLHRIDQFRSMSNPALLELDELTRELFFALCEQKGYAPQELVT